MTTKVLYYPTIEFMDEVWLKSSLCVCDKVFRIVPDSYHPKDSDEVKIAIDNGVVENISLTEQDLSETADEFIDFVESVDIFGGRSPSEKSFLQSYLPDIGHSQHSGMSHTVWGYVPRLLYTSLLKNQNFPLKSNSSQDYKKIFLYGKGIYDTKTAQSKVNMCKLQYCLQLVASFILLLFVTRI